MEPCQTDRQNYSFSIVDYKKFVDLQRSLGFLSDSVFHTGVAAQNKVILALFLYHLIDRLQLFFEFKILDLVNVNLA